MQSRLRPNQSARPPSNQMPGHSGGYRADRGADRLARRRHSAGHDATTSASTGAPSACGSPGRRPEQARQPPQRRQGEARDAGIRPVGHCAAALIPPPRNPRTLTWEALKNGASPRIVTLPRQPGQRQARSSSGRTLARSTNRAQRSRIGRIVLPSHPCSSSARAYSRDHRIVGEERLGADTHGLASFSSSASALREPLHPIAGQIGKPPRNRRRDDARLRGLYKHEIPS